MSSHQKRASFDTNRVQSMNTQEMFTAAGLGVSGSLRPTNGCGHWGVKVVRQGHRAMTCRNDIHTSLKRKKEVKTEEECTGREWNPGRTNVLEGITTCFVRPIQSLNSNVFGVVALRNMRWTDGGSIIIT